MIVRSDKLVMAQKDNAGEPKNQAESMSDVLRRSKELFDSPSIDDADKEEARNLYEELLNRARHQPTVNDVLKEKIEQLNAAIESMKKE